MPFPHRIWGAPLGVAVPDGYAPVIVGVVGWVGNAWGVEARAMKMVEANVR